jgi:hypothetical protein
MRRSENDPDLEPDPWPSVVGTGAIDQLTEGPMEVPEREFPIGFDITPGQTCNTHLRS